MSEEIGRRASFAALVIAGCLALLAIGQLRSPAATAAPGSRAPDSRNDLPALQPYPEGVYLNEFMPRPVSDWNGNGYLGDADDEYIEIYNSNDYELDLSDWQLDDADGTGTTQPFTLPAGSVIPEHSFLVFFSIQTRIGLNNNGGDSVRLLYPDGSVADEYSYLGTPPSDQSFSRTIDGGGTWVITYPPSPGLPNLPPPPTATPTATPTPTTGPTPTPFPAGITLNEFLPDPASDWNDDGEPNQYDEYIEIFNSSALPVDLSGWMLDDIQGGTSPYIFPAGTVIQPFDMRVFFRSETGVGLNDDSSDSARLLYPDGSVADQYSYLDNPPEDQSYSRTIDGGGMWVTTYPPSPGTPNQPPPTDTPTPTRTATATPTVTRTPTATRTVT
ncbi:MAG: lamin tail domain-containing protein, partial [Anaerolineae bacterium]|nr:lamin tail domain-containing protein [Anaerolineae bacterium]